jgi:hypothetical protein
MAGPWPGYSQFGRRTGVNGVDEKTFQDLFAPGAKPWERSYGLAPV